MARGCSRSMSPFPGRSRGPTRTADAPGRSTSAAHEEVASAEAQVAAGDHPERPFVIASQPVVADATRAPVGTHILWAYCHVPRGSSRDMTDAILAQVERFAPGFQDVVLAVNRRSPADLESDNPNHVGGDITGGELSIRGLFARPKVFRPYRATRGYTCAQRRRLQAQGCTECAGSAADAVLRKL